MKWKTTQAPLNSFKLSNIPKHVSIIPESSTLQTDITSTWTRSGVNSLSAPTTSVAAAIACTYTAHCEQGAPAKRIWSGDIIFPQKVRHHHSSVLELSTTTSTAAQRFGKWYSDPQMVVKRRSLMRSIASKLHRVRMQFLLSDGRSGTNLEKGKNEDDSIRARVDYRVFPRGMNEEIGTGVFSSLSLSLLNTHKYTHTLVRICTLFFSPWWWFVHSIRGGMIKKGRK